MGPKTKTNLFFIAISLIISGIFSSLYLRPKDTLLIYINIGVMAIGAVILALLILLSKKGT
jgi:hypothetical protein